MDQGDLSLWNLSTLSSALDASEARFRNIIEMNADGILVISRDDATILYANPAAISLLERRHDQLLGREFGIPMVPGETTEVELPLAGNDIRVAEMRVAETEWEGRPVHLASLRDVSDRKKLEEELRHTIQELDQADRRKNEFLAMLAHELRNPLAPILNAVHIMRLCGDDPRLLASMRDVIEQQVRGMARLVDDLLDVSRITRGKIELRYESTLLSTIVHRAVETSRPLIMAKQHELRIALPAQIIELWADPLRIEQVLTNLLNNAAKYTDLGGRIDLEAQINQSTVIFRIRDSGVGITHELLSEIFDLFAQADQSLDRSQGGLGIGLTLARNLVQMHHGTVEARSAGLGKGSEFIVTLPCVQSPQFGNSASTPDSTKVHAPCCSPSFRDNGNGISHDHHSRRILVVDDNIASAESLATIIKLWGHECRIAHTGPDGLSSAENFRPELMLLDIGLPGMDGYSVARELRNRPHHHALILVAMTGYGRDEDRARSLTAGFNHHLVKPLDLNLLESFVTNLVSQP